MLLAVVGTAGFAASLDPTPQQQIATLKKKLSNARSDLADANDQIDLLNSANDDQNDTITRLRYRLANQPDPIDVITARGPVGLWNAMIAIWQEFPRLDPADICGFDKSMVPGDDLTPDLTSYTFYRWIGC